ncbi:hypothetical protein [Pasteurella phage vB_PmuP_Pa7]|uniref:Uncharacterized protein n=1 Tax=Pasteurella phage vB_PmuP_Pa7 TaxID=2767198 RepID=A0A7G8ZYP3_9CAUD|nr:hypothetical protein [Pasteurella phage vB_PmuP_Pa7]
MAHYYSEMNEYYSKREEAFNSDFTDKLNSFLLDKDTIKTVKKLHQYIQGGLPADNVSCYRAAQHLERDIKKLQGDRPFAYDNKGLIKVLNGLLSIAEYVIKKYEASCVDYAVGYITRGRYE